MTNFNSTIAFAIAQTAVNKYIEAQADQADPEPKRQIAQRKAKYHDKNRTRRRDVQQWVYRRTGLPSTQQVKAALKKLGKKLDLRLTSAWLEINLNWCDAIAEAVKTDRINESAIADSKFKVGDRVNLVEYSARLAYLESWSPFSILAIADGIAKLELISFPVPVTQLQLAVA